MMFGNVAIFGGAGKKILFTFDGDVFARTNAKSGATPTWTLGVSSYTQVNTPAHTFVVSEGKGRIASSDGFGFTTFDMNACNLVTLDMRNAEILSGIFDVNSNPNLTSLLLPTTTGTFTVFHVNDCDLTGAINLSTLSKLGGSILLDGNSNLTSAVFPTSAEVITELNIASCDITGVLNVSGLSKLGGVLQFSSNPNMTNISLPASSQTITSFRAGFSGLNTTLDLSGLTGLGGELNLEGCTTLTGITHPVSSNNISYWVTGTAITSLDFTGLTGLNNSIRLHDNSSLTSITNLSSTNSLTLFNAYSCDLTGTLDISGLTALRFGLSFRDNPNLTDVTFPTHTLAFFNITLDACDLGYIDLTPMSARSDRDSYALKLQNNNMIAAEVNQILVNEDTDSVIGTYTGRTIDISGTNQTYDGTSGGFDAVTAVANLIAKNFSFTATQFDGFSFTIDGDTVAKTNTKTGDTLSWDFDGTTYTQNNTPAHTLGVGAGDVRVTSSDGWSGFTKIDLASCNLTALDLRNTTNITNYNIVGNPNLTSLIMPTSSAASPSLIQLYDNDLTGTLDFSGMSGFGGNIQGYGNSNLTSIIFPTSSSGISYLWWYNCNLTGAIDISGLSGLGGNIRFSGNALLTSIANPTSSTAITIYNVSGCDITGTLDTSGLTGLGGVFNTAVNGNLTGLTMPTTSGVFSQIQIYDCDLTGVIDFSGMSGFGGNVQGYGNANLTGLTMPTSSTTTNYFWFYNCDLTGTLDLSGMTGLGFQTRLYSNPNLTGITFGASSNTFSQIQLYSCDLGYVDLTPLSARSDVNNYGFQIQNNNMTAAEVNQILVNEDSDSIDGGYTGRSIDISGTNDTYDGTSGGFDAVTAVANLVAKNFAITATQFPGFSFTIDGDTVGQLNSKVGAIPVWDFDGTTYNSVNTPAHTLGAGAGNVRVTSTDGFGFTDLTLDSCNVTTVDLRNAPTLSGLLHFRTNPNLTSVQFATMSGNFTQVWFDNCKLTTFDLSKFTGDIGYLYIDNNELTSVTTEAGTNANVFSYCRIISTGLVTLDLSGYTALSGILNFNGNSSMTTLTLPTTTGSWSSIDVTNTAITTIDLSGYADGGHTLYIRATGMTSFTAGTNTTTTSFVWLDGNNFTTCDLSGWTNLGGNVYAQNSGITTLTLPTSSQTITRLDFADNAITGTQSAANLTGLSGTLEFDGNSGLTGFTFPSTTGTFTEIDFGGCDLGYVDLTPMSARSDVNNYTLRLLDNSQTAAEVNQELVNEDDDSIDGGYTGRSINIAGTNSTYDGTSGGFDAVTAVASLVAKNFTVTATQFDGISFTIDGNTVAKTNTKSGATLVWDLGVSQYTQNNTPAHTYVASQGDCRITSSDGWSGLTVFNMSGCNLTLLDLRNATAITTYTLFSNANLTSVNFPVSSATIVNIELLSCDITGVLDISGLTGLAGSLSFYSNSNMTGITNPTSSGVITAYRAYSCDLTGTLDISNLTGLGGTLEFYSNSNLTDITFPTSSQTASINVHSCDLTGTLDISGMTGLATSFRFYSNANLTGITFPTSSNVISTIEGSSCGLTGTLDISGLSALAGIFDIYSNSNLTGITNPTSSGVFTRYRAYSCDLTGTISLSGLTGLAGVLDLYSNPNLTGITNPTSSGIFTQYYVYSCGLTGTLSLANLTGLGGSFSCRSNSGLTGLTLPSSSQAFTLFYVWNCGFTGTLDLSNLTGLGGNIQGHGNTSMTGVTFPTSSESVTTLRFENCDLTGTVSVSGLTNFTACQMEFGSNSAMTGFTPSTDSGATFTKIGLAACDLGHVDLSSGWVNRSDISGYTLDISDNNMTAAEVNEQLVDEDTDSIDGGYTGRAIIIDGTNAAPDTTSGGFDGDAAVTSLVAKNFIVTTS